MAKMREIRKRLSAVGNIQRITKTMQMIATAKFTAAVARAKATKPFTQRIRQLSAEVAEAAGDVQHPLMSGPRTPVRRELFLVISSDRGLAGAYNANVLNKAKRAINETKSRGTQITLEVAGKKAVGFFKFQQVPVAQRNNIGDKPKYDEVEKVARRYINEFSAGKYDAVRVAYMRFESNSRQLPEVMQLLPIRAVSDQRSAVSGQQPTAESQQPKAKYEFSPSSQALLEDLLPLTVKTALFQAFNDAVVSEQIMRMVAMKAATENAKDLGKTLRRQFNRARQTKITTELTEIIGGAAALE